MAKVDCPIDKLFATIEALVLTPLDTRRRFKRRLTLVAFSGTTILKKVSIECLSLFSFSIALTILLNLGGYITNYWYYTEILDYSLGGSKIVLALPLYISYTLYITQIS